VVFCLKLKQIPNPKLCNQNDVFLIETDLKLKSWSSKVPCCEEINFCFNISYFLSFLSFPKCSL